MCVLIPLFVYLNRKATLRGKVLEKGGSLKLFAFYFEQQIVDWP